MKSEAELHVHKKRMYQGKLNKERRGAFMGIPPIGYVRLVSGEWRIDPEDQVQCTESRRPKRSIARPGYTR
jgi:hypothetical protein